MKTEDEDLPGGIESLPAGSVADPDQPHEDETDTPLLSDEKADEDARDDEFEDLDAKPLDFDDAPPMRRS
jgi:hypothetical protein